MSQENVELVRRSLDSVNRGDIDGAPEEIIEVDESRLIVVNRVRMRGRGSGVEVDAVGAQLWTIHDGKAQSFKLCQSKAEALEAAGLQE